MVIFHTERTHDRKFNTRAEAEAWVKREKFKFRQAGFSVKTVVKLDRNSNQWTAIIQIGDAEKDV